MGVFASHCSKNGDTYKFLLSCNESVNSEVE